MNTRVGLVGIGCRLPGGIRSPDEFVRFLREHGDAVVDVPPDRWNVDLHYDPDPEAPGKSHVRRGAFLEDDVFSFDPEPFGIPSKEAEHLDPQQRLLLEVTWEAFEDAGIPIDRVRGGNVAVFIGGFTLDQQTIAYLPENRRLVSRHTSVGSSMTLLSNRISYTFDLRGPSVTVDTACSSSLVAAHLGCEAILHGGCDLAIVGGVNVMMSPAVMAAMSKGKFLAADGRSKTFDASADGYGRGEGAAVVVLKRMDRAVRDRDRIYASIIASGINQDGRTLGIAMPSEDAQRSLGERVLSASNLRSRDIGYVEAHGTGTKVGDAVEARALGAVYGKDRDGPLLIGSVKTNIGHLEAAAGVTGLIKAALSVHHREVFPVRAVDVLNPDIAFEELNLEVARHSQAWPTDGPARAAVNAFGYGGTNAHVILGEAREAARETTEPRTDVVDAAASGLLVVPLSAAGREALLAQADQLSRVVHDASWTDQALTLARHRSHLPERAAVLVSSAAELREQLQRVAREDFGDDRVAGHASAPRRLLWVFTGMGPQWWAMGQELNRSDPVFRRAVEGADRAFQSVAGWSVLAEMMREEPDSRMRSNAVAQPANFLLQVGLVSVLRHLGVPEHAHLGHSVGEVAAAWAAGCLSLRDAAFVAFHRSRLQQKVAGQGTMLAVALSEPEIHRFATGLGDVAIAAYNARRSVTLSGSQADLSTLADRLSAEGVFNRWVPVEVAYHSPHMDPLEEEFRTVLEKVVPRIPEKPLYSTTRGTRLTAADHDAVYWWENARRPVLLQRALELAIADGHTAFLEIGPHPVLSWSIREVATEQGKDPRTFFCLKRGQPEGRTVRRAIASMYTAGVDPDWRRLHPQGRMTELPRYPFCRKPYWVESVASRELRLGRPDHRFTERQDGRTLTLVCDLARPSLAYLLDHRIDGAAVFPAAGYIDCALAACLEMDAGRSEYVLEGVRFERALIVRPGSGPALRVDIRREDGTFDILARNHDEAWTRHGFGHLLDGAVYPNVEPVDVERLRADLTEIVDVEDIYRDFARRGLQYGPAFRGLRSLQLRRAPGGRTTLLGGIRIDHLDENCTTIQPSLLDAAFQAMLVAVSGVPGAMVPVAAERVRWFASTGVPVWVRCDVGPAEDGEVRADLLLLADHGAPVLEIRGLRCRALDARNAGEATARADLFHLDAWRESPWPPQPIVADDEVWGLAGTASALLSGVEDCLRHRGIRTRRLDRVTAPSARGCAGLVFAMAPDESDPVGVSACDDLRQLVQLLGPFPRALRIMTFGAHAVAAEDLPSPAQAALSGFGRVIMTEHPELGCRLIDLSRVAAPPSSQVVDLLGGEGVDEQVALRNGALFTYRVRRATQAEMGPRAHRVPVDEYGGAFAIEKARGLDSVRLVPSPRAALAPGEVEVAVHWASVDPADGLERSASRDLRTCLQRRPRSLVGSVVRTAAPPGKRRPGELVYALQRSELGSHVVLNESRALSVCRVHAPQDAVAYGALFLAWYALVEVGRLGEGDCVLIHDAGGLAGSACVQVAKARRARIFATAFDEDHVTLHDAGVERIYSAHDLGFVDGVLRDTSGKGVHVVAGALTDPVRVKSVEVLGATGRLVDLNAASFDRTGGVEPPQVRRGQTFCVADLDALADDRPDVYRRIGETVIARIAEGSLALAPVIAVGFDAAPDASAWTHLGAPPVARAVDLRASDAMVDTAGAPLMRPDRTYLVTGGLAGFGLRTAEWLVQEGARTLVLGSRRGRVASEDAAALDRMRAAGARVECRSLDVSDERSIDDLLAFVRVTLPPLAGVFHSAMVLDDQPIRSMNTESSRRVMLPKALGAWLLHRKTCDEGLDHFVLYSSVSAIVGNPSQAAYAAANASLEALAALRRAEGLPATCVAWGALDDVGIVARDEATRIHLRRLGVQPLPAQVALLALGQALRARCGFVGIIDMDWARWMSSFPRTPWGRLVELHEPSAAASGERAPGGLRDELAGLDSADRRRRVLELVREAAAHALGTSVAGVNEETPLKSYGFDSLMAVQLQAAIEGALGVTIPAIHFLSGGSVSELCERTLEALLAEPVPPSTERVIAADRAEGDLREYFLSRICVQPPYFDLLDFSRDGEWVEAFATPTPPHEIEDDVISCAEAARHLAIIGSCAVSLQFAAPGRVYYPVRRAYSAPVRDGSNATASAAQPLQKVRVRARCLSLDVAASRATAETELFDLDGEVIFKLMVDYHVIPADDFGRLFAEHREPTDEQSGLDPYAVWANPACRMNEDGSLAIDVGPVDPAACLGHFVGCPALPVSVMTRYAIVLVGEEVRRKTAGDARITVLSGWAETTAFLFAHETATMTARCLDEGNQDGEASGQTWLSEVRRGDDIIATFELVIRVVPSRTSEVRLVNREAFRAATRASVAVPTSNDAETARRTTRAASPHRTRKSRSE
jgi:acyl transferase domain-containing protein/NAD(P)-dependent dehydrogenase (short-subunit alcohol dehydrogenase family)/NADPH-dependent curcumin reductase CurA/acyl carrier protein